MLVLVKKYHPNLYPWAVLGYGDHSKLFYGSSIIMSRCGVQQGDPLGPALFSVVVAEFNRKVSEKVSGVKNVWYLDDGSYIGPKDKVFEVLRVTSTLGKDFGLILNEKKTTIINPYGIASGKFNRPPSIGDVEDLDASFAVEELDIPQNINISRDHGVVFLGVPIPVLHPELNVNKDAANEFMENFLLDKIHSVGKDIERIFLKG